MPPAPFRDPELGWSMLAGVGLAFLVIGSLDIEPVFWIPVGLGIPHWDFDQVKPSYTNALPLLTLGLALLLAAAAATGRRRWVLLFSSVLLSLGTMLIMAPLVYGVGVGMAWWSGNDPVKLFHLKSVLNDGLWRAT